MSYHDTSLTGGNATIEDRTANKALQQTANAAAEFGRYTLYGKKRVLSNNFLISASDFECDEQVRFCYKTSNFKNGD